MKKTFTNFLLSVLALLMIPLTVGAQDATFDFQNNNGNWPVGEGANYADGDVSTLEMNGVRLTGLQGESFNPVRIMKNASRGTCLWIYKMNSVKFNAPEGKALVKIEVTMQSATFDIAPSNGEVTDDVWTGNATEVTFGPNEIANRFIYVFKVYLNDENEETIKPVAVDVETADIAGFNAVEDGKIVKLMLHDAKVNGYHSLQNCYYVEDASGATVIRDAQLTAGTVLNGFIVGVKGTDNAIDYTNDPPVVEHFMNSTDANNVVSAEGSLSGTVMSVPEACAQTNYGKLITIENVSISGSGKNKTLTDANNNSMKARDYLSVLPADYTWPENVTKITGVLVFYITDWYLMPISEEAIVAKGEQPNSVTFDFSDPNFRENIGEKIGDVKGNIYNETFIVDNVSFQVTAGSAPTKLYVDDNRGQNLVIYPQYATLIFKAPESYAITKIEFTAAGASNINKMTASSGNISGMTWTGNTDGVRFAQGGTSNLKSAVVTLAEKTMETTTLPAIEYTECANIAAFNALEAGTYAIINLTDAEVIGKSADGFSTVWLQDATGGCWMQYTSLNDQLSEGMKVNGEVYAVKRLVGGNSQIKEAEATIDSELTTESISEYTIAEGTTISQVNIDANLNKVVKLSGATLEETSATAGTLTIGEESIAVNNGSSTANQQLCKISDWSAGTTLTDITVVAILVAKSATENQLLPISIIDATGIYEVNADNFNQNVTVYNIQGMRMNGFQKGLNIANGRKVFIK